MKQRKFRKKEPVVMTEYDPETMVVTRLGGYPFTVVFNGDRAATVNPNDAREHGSPKVGDMIAHNPADPSDNWLVSAEQIARLYEEVE